MGEHCGLSFRREENDERDLGRDWMSRRGGSENKAAEIDHEVSRMLRGLCADALRRLREHRTLLDRIAEALLERETLDGGDLAPLMAGYGTVGLRGAPFRMLFALSTPMLGERILRQLLP